MSLQFQHVFLHLSNLVYLQVLNHYIVQEKGSPKSPLRNIHPFSILYVGALAYFCQSSILNLPNDLCNLIPQHLLPGHDLFNLGVELDDVDDLPGVLRLHIGADRQIVFILGDLLVGDAACEMVYICPGDELIHDVADVLLSQLIVIGDLDTLRRSINKEGTVVRLALFSTMMQVAMEVP